jgi:hypothetical protein
LLCAAIEQGVLQNRSHTRRTKNSIKFGQHPILERSAPRAKSLRQSRGFLST